jgi:hypothetical protein
MRTGQYSEVEYCILILYYLAYIHEDRSVLRGGGKVLEPPSWPSSVK